MQCRSRRGRTRQCNQGKPAAAAAAEVEADPAADCRMRSACAGRVHMTSNTRRTNRTRRSRNRRDTADRRHTWSFSRTPRPLSRSRTA